MPLDPPESPTQVVEGSDPPLTPPVRAGDDAVHRRRRVVAIGAITTGVLAIALVLVLSLPGDIPGEPTIVDASELTLRPATLPAPEPSPGAPSLLKRTEQAGPAHPNWEQTLGWRATGARTDVLQDRRVVTVFYEQDGQRIGYAIVLGPHLPPPAATTDQVVGGVRLRSFLVKDRPVVTWVRGGYTCILSGRNVDVQVLLDLAGSGPGKTAASPPPT